MKMYKKSDLQLINGLLVTEDGTIVMPDQRIVVQANTLEDMVQKMAYLKDQPEFTPAPSLDGFERMSINDTHAGEFRASTPTLDAKVEEAMAIMDEVDKMMLVDKANELQAALSELLQFVSNDFVIDCGGNRVLQFDTPVLGNVLELDRDTVVEAIGFACGASFTKIHEAGDDSDDDDLGIDQGDLDSLRELLKEIDDLCSDESIDKINDEEEPEEE